MPVSQSAMDQTHSSRPPKPSEPIEAIGAEAIEALDRELPIWSPELIVAAAIALDVALPSKVARRTGSR
jgi:hypothetical protein